MNKRGTWAAMAALVCFAQTSFGQSDLATQLATAKVGDVLALAAGADYNQPPAGLMRVRVTTGAQTPGVETWGRSLKRGQVLVAYRLEQGRVADQFLLLAVGTGFNLDSIQGWTTVQKVSGGGWLVSNQLPKPARPGPRVCVGTVAPYNGAIEATELAAVSWRAAPGATGNVTLLDAYPRRVELDLSADPKPTQSAGRVPWPKNATDFAALKVGEKVAVPDIINYEIPLEGWVSVRSIKVLEQVAPAVGRVVWLYGPEGQTAVGVVVQVVPTWLEPGYAFVDALSMTAAAGRGKWTLSPVPSVTPSARPTLAQAKDQLIGTVVELPKSANYRRPPAGWAMAPMFKVPASARVIVPGTVLQLKHTTGKTVNVVVVVVEPGKPGSDTKAAVYAWISQADAAVIRETPGREDWTLSLP